MSSASTNSYYSQYEETLGQPGDRVESPSTPRAHPDRVEYFESGPSVTSSTRSQSQALSLSDIATPKRSFVVTSRKPQSGISPQASDACTISVPGSSKTNLQPTQWEAAVVPRRVNTTDLSIDQASIHGEQGSDWGDDEAQFEWLDTDAPEAINGSSKRIEGINMSPSRKLSVKLKAVVKPALVGVNIGENKKLRKPMVLPRRAAPPPPDGPGSPPAQSLRPLSPSKHSASKRRAKAFMETPPTSKSDSHPVVLPVRPPLTLRWTDTATSRTPSPNRLARPKPSIIPLKEDDNLLNIPKPRNIARNSQMSFQSMAYSFYDLENEGDSPTTPTAHEVAFPHGKYMKVSVSALEKDREIRDRSMSDPIPRHGADSPDKGQSNGTNPVKLVHDGVQARGKGDLAKSAWFFMRAAEAGDATGRMYWGEYRAYPGHSSSMISCRSRSTTWVGRHI